MDLDLSPDERRFQDEVGTWLHEHVPKEAPPPQGEASRAFDLDWQKVQFQGGWAGIDWPKEYGGRGLSLTEQLIWYEESAKAGAPPAGVCFVGLYHGGPTLIVKGDATQKSFHLPKILQGEAVWCQGFSEPGAGSDLAALRTKAEIDGEYLVVSGSKIWTSYAHLADYQELLVRTGAGSKKHDGITWVICDMKTPGITVRPIKSAAGIHHLNQVFYDDVRIPLANVVGDLNDGWRTAMCTLSFERGTAFTAAQVELAKFVDELIDTARARIGRARFTDSELGQRLSRLRSDTAALRAMTYVSVARNRRRGTPGPDGSMLKIQLARLKFEASNISLRLMASRAFLLTDVTVEFLHSFAHKIGGGADEIQHNIVAERVLGLPRSY